MYLVFSDCTFRELLVNLVHKESEENVVCLALEGNLVTKEKKVEKELRET